MNLVSTGLNLGGRTALITGGAGGLGSVIASTLAELGCTLILVDLDETKLIEKQQEVRDRFQTEVIVEVCDLESEEQRSSLISKINTQNGHLNILVNNAAFVGTSNLEGWAVPFETQSVGTFRRALEVNLVAPFDLARGLSQLMRGSEGASIVNIASIYGQFGPDWKIYSGTVMGNPAAYAASKAGLIQLTRWMATTLAPQIRVNAISPGGVRSNQSESFIVAYETRTPLGRMAEYSDFSGAIAYLASDLSKYVTGQVLNVDGGWGIW